ncbi:MULTISPECIES: BglG family transcription antiterminator [Bacillus]|uniref:BglG family transcription antiterminator n=1 Tax=Bacillus TaxID=1386 RepID=UPI001581A5DC|nr:BglG family transcription antiterminator [Bacillus glycinifermentans]MBU8785132.1 BglG family transcription antiterminator [Bacillus glycinifermentans]NUJ15302.1 transcription antiterminator [Bacillus glycinifermentans]
MKPMNTRQKDILYLLISEPEDYLLVRDIADRAKCSEKTIRNDLKAIEEFLTEHSDAELIRKPGAGVSLKIEEHEKMRLSRKLCLKQRPKVQTDEERVLEIAYRLLMNAKPVTVKEIAAQHFLNKSVIKRDLDMIKEWLKDFHLTLISKQRIGLMIEGNEKNKRKALARISDLIENQEFASEFMKKQFLSHEVKFVTNEISALQKRHSLRFTDETFESLLLHTLLMIRRMKMKQPISISREEMALVQKKKEYQWASAFLKKLERVFAVQFPEEEVVYLTLHILGGKVRYPLWQDEEESVKNPLLSDVLDHLVDRVSKLKMIDFRKDAGLIEGLSIHLNTVLNRLNYDLSVSNPMLHDIKKMYPYMFHTVVDVLEDINQSFQLSIPEEEAAYLTLHFQAASERMNCGSRTQKKAIIVCHMGIGMSQLLRTKIELAFHQIAVLDCIAKADVADYLANHEDVELVISTVSLEAVKVPHVVVSPLLEPADEKKLGIFMDQLDQPSRNKQKTFTMLNNTTPFLVFLQQDAEHRYKLIETLAMALYQKGYVEKDYALHAVVREKMSATSIGGGIAIPHANSKFIKKSAIAIATLKEPLDWGNEKVSLVFMLAVKQEDRDMTRQLFHELSFLSEQPAFVQKLTKETNVMKFLSYLDY